MFIFTIYVHFLLGILAILMKKSRIVALSIFALSLFLMSFNNWNIDYDVYLSFYNNPSMIEDIGFYLLCVLFRELGFEYDVLVFFISFFSLLVIYKSINYFTDDIALAFFLYTCTNFFVDAIQLRNLLAMSIFLYSIRYINIKMSKMDIMKYSLFVLLASSFHYLFIIYLAIPVVIKLNNKYLLLFSVALPFVLYNILNIASRFIPKIDIYMYRDFNIVLGILFAIYMCGYFIPGIYSIYECLYNEKIKEMHAFALINICIILCVTTFLCIINLNFHRIARNFIPILCCYYVILFDTKTNIVKILNLLLLIATIAASIIYNNQMIFDIYTHNLLQDFLESNI